MRSIFCFCLFLSQVASAKTGITVVLGEKTTDLILKNDFAGAHLFYSNHQSSEMKMPLTKLEYENYLHRIKALQKPTEEENRKCSRQYIKIYIETKSSSFCLNEKTKSSLESQKLANALIKLF